MSKNLKNKREEIVLFQKGVSVQHEKFGKGTYSHIYAEDASIVKFDVVYKDGIQTRVVLDRDIKKI